MNALAQGFRDFRNDLTILVWPILLATTGVTLFFCYGGAG